MHLGKRSCLSLLLAFIIAFSGTAFTLAQTAPAVEAEAASAKISKKKKTVYVGQVFNLKIKNSKKDYVWKSTNSEVAMVVSGAGQRAQIGAFKAGKVTITATCGKKVFKCKVTVKEKPEETEDSKTGKDTEKDTGKDTEKDNGKDTKDKDDKSGSDDSGNKIDTNKDNQQPGNDEKQNTGTTKTDTITVPTLEEELASDTYGLLYSHKKTDYIPRTNYDTVINSEDDLLKVMIAGVQSGTRGIVAKYGSMTYNYWKTKYLELIDRSEMYNAANEFCIENEEAGTLSIFPMYKEGWYALVYYRYTRPGMDEDLRDYIKPNDETIKILKMAHELAEDAIKAHPGDERAILKYVNDKICDLTTYSNPIPQRKDDPARDIMGVFVNHDAVCEGYTAAMQLVLNILGFENQTIKNKADTHIWNRVKVDGTWYHIDATWNDRQNSDGSYEDAWFMLTDDELDKKNAGASGHAWNKPKYLD